MEIMSITWNKYGLVVSSLPFPQGDEGSIPIMAKLNKGEWGVKGAKVRSKGQACL
jgi:hypothetical protein